MRELAIGMTLVLLPACGSSEHGDPHSAAGQGCPSPLPTAEPAVHRGDLALSDALSVAQAWSLTEVTGNLELATTVSDLSTISLPNLRHLGGDLNAYGTPYERLHFPNLESIAGRLYLDGNAGLERTDFRSLTEAGDVFVVRNPSLRSVGLGSLRQAGSLQFNSNPLVDCLGPVSVAGAEPMSPSQELEVDVAGECIEQCDLWLHDSVGLAGVLTDLDGLGPPKASTDFDLSGVVHYPDVPTTGDLQFSAGSGSDSLHLLGSAYLQYPDRRGPLLGHWLAAVQNAGDAVVCELMGKVELQNQEGETLFAAQGPVRAPVMQTSSGKLSGCLNPGEVGLLAVSGDPIVTEHIAQRHFGLSATQELEPPTPVALNLNHSFSDAVRPSVSGSLQNDTSSSFADWRVDVFILNEQGIPIGHGHDDRDAGPALGVSDSASFSVPLYSVGAEVVVFPSLAL